MSQTIIGRAAPAAGSRPPIDLIGAGWAEHYLADYADVAPATADELLAMLKGGAARLNRAGIRRLLELEAEAAAAREAEVVRTATSTPAIEPGTPTDVDVDQPFDQWAVVELMGHRRLAGRVREVQIAGAGMLRIDIPATPGRPARTQYDSPAALYALHPCDEATARATAAALVAPEPVERWRLTAVPAAGPGDDLDDNDDLWGDR